MKMKNGVVIVFFRLLILFAITCQFFGGIDAMKSKPSSSSSGGKKKPLASSSNIQKAKPYGTVAKTWKKYYKDSNNLLPSNKMASGTKKGAEKTISAVENKFPAMSAGKNLGGTNNDEKYKVRMDHQGYTSNGKHNVQAQINKSHAKELKLSGKDKTSIGGVTGSNRFFAHNDGKTAAETMQQSIDANKMVSVHTSPISSPPRSPGKRRRRSLLIGHYPPSISINTIHYAYSPFK